MDKGSWRNLVCGTATVFFAAGLFQSVFADEVGDETIVVASQSETSNLFKLMGPIAADVTVPQHEKSAATQDAAGVVQVAQGVTTYEQRRREPARPRRGETVESRPRPQYDPLGVRMGSFVLFPELNVQEQYETNIFATENNEDDDFITRILPNLTLRSDWNNHQLIFESGADIGFYADHSSEDFQDYFLGARGRVDVRRSTQLLLGTRFSHLHDSRENPDSPGNADEPTQFNLYSADTSLRHDFGRINAEVAGSFERFSYEDPDAVGGGEVNEHERDRDIYTGSLRVGYEIQPTYEAFVRATYNRRVYDGTEAGTGIDRDSHGVNGVAGMDVDFGGIIFGEFFLGYGYQDYEDSSLENISGLNGGADMTWNVTGLTTITGLLTGGIRETTQAGASGRLVTTGAIGVDHELRRNLLLGGNVSVTRDDYEGISRTDWVYRAGADMTYLINRYLRAALGYEFAKRDADSGFSSDDFTNHTILVRVGLQY